MEKFSIEEFFNAGHKNVEGLFILLSNSDDPEVREVVSNIKRDENLRRQFNEIVQGATQIELAGIYNMFGDLTATTIYKLIMNNPLVQSLQENNSVQFQPIEDISHYNLNLNNLKKSLIANRGSLNLIKGISPEIQLMLHRLPESRKKYDNFQDFVGELIKLYSILEKNKEICFDTHENFVEYTNLAIPLNKKIISQLKICESKVKSIEDYGMGVVETGVGVIGSFVNEWTILNAQTTTATIREKKFRNDVQAEIDKVKQETRKVEPKISDAEQERRRAIKEANDLYEEFCQDFLRDLQNQYALSSKDLYEYFINEKFAKFMERFQMPLSDSETVGKANEAYSQIKNLMKYVSKISENSYTTSVYPNEKQ